MIILGKKKKSKEEKESLEWEKLVKKKCKRKNYLNAKIKW